MVTNVRWLKYTPFLSSHTPLFGVLLLAALVGPSQAQTILIDDFDDGDDVGWTHIDSTYDEAWGPGIHAVVDGRYVMEGNGKVPSNFSGYAFVASRWDESVSPEFSNGFFRATLRSEDEGNYAAVVMRTTGDPDDRDSFDGYLFAGDTEYGTFLIAPFENSINQRLFTMDPDDYPYVPEEDWIIEAGANGDELTLKVWRPGEPEPDAPQLTVIDDTYASGWLGVVANVSFEVPDEPEALVSGTFDDLQFRFPIAQGDFNGDGILDVLDIDELAAKSAGNGNDSMFDLTGDSLVDYADVVYWVKDLFHTWIGDSNLDGQFDTEDLVAVLASGEYQDDITGNSVWSTGDWNGDGEANSSDLVEALAGGGYEQGQRPAAAAVPEPTSTIQLIGLAVLAIQVHFRGPLRVLGALRV